MKEKIDFYKITQIFKNILPSCISDIAFHSVEMIRPIPVKMKFRQDGIYYKWLFRTTFGKQTREAHGP